MKEQTAVEWLEERLNRNGLGLTIEEIKQAKEMEKSQHERMYSEEDMKLSFETGRNFQLTGEDNFNELIQQFKEQAK
jgi:hypothetical protein